MMPNTKTLLQRLSSFISNDIADHEIDEELNFHLEMRTEDNIAVGMTEEEARKEALRRFGDIEQTKRTCRKINQDSPTKNFMNGLLLLIALGGLAIRALHPDEAVGTMGQMIAINAILFRLLLHMRRTSPKKSFVYGLLWLIALSGLSIMMFH